MSPLQHAHVWLEKVAHANFQIAIALLHNAFVSLRNVISQVFESVLARLQGAGNAPGNYAGAVVYFDRNAAVGDGAAAGHAQRASEQYVAHLNIHLARDHRVVRDDDFTRAGIFREMLQVKVKLAIQTVAE